MAVPVLDRVNADLIIEALREDAAGKPTNRMMVSVARALSAEQVSAGAEPAGNRSSH